MATIKVEVTYDPKKETLSQALASLLTEKPEHTEITAQMSLFDNPAPTETPTAQASTEEPSRSSSLRMTRPPSRRSSRSLASQTCPLSRKKTIPSSMRSWWLLMAKHALLSASGAHRWLLCTPSAQLEQKFPTSTSAYAEEGTVAHALAELTTRYFLGELDEVAYENQIKSEFEPNSYYNAEMRECAVAYAKFVTGRLAEAKKTCPDAMIILETRLDFSKYVPGGFGTGDCVIIAEPILDVIDFKYGKGHRVEAEDNPQMQLYGLGALEQFGDLYEIKTVRMTIFQPRLSGIEDSSEKTVKELTSWGKSYVKPRAKLADKGEGDFAPIEEACRFCRAKNQCRARAGENLKLFDESPDPLLISPEEAGAILAKSADIETWLKDLRELVSGALTAGETVTGWKMVEGRSNRKFADEDKVVAAMKAAGYDESLLYDRKLITLTQMERDFGKKTLTEILGDLIVKPQGAPTLAPESDKRPAYRFEDQVLKAFDE